MIENEQQYQARKAQIKDIQKSLGKFSANSAKKDKNNVFWIKVDQDGLVWYLEQLQKEIADYDNFKANKP